MLNVAPVRREYETLPGINRLGIPAVAPLPTGETASAVDVIVIVSVRFESRLPRWS